MSPRARVLFHVALRLILLAGAAWFGFSADSVPGAPVTTRLALAALFLVLGVVVGEVATLRLEMGLLGSVIRGSGRAAVSRDDRAAVEILIKGLSVPVASTRDASHRQLKRLTGADLPPDAAAWEKWWQENRDGFAARRDLA